MALCLFRRVARASSAALRLQQVSRQSEVCAPSAIAERHGRARLPLPS